MLVALAWWWWALLGIAGFILLVLFAVRLFRRRIRAEFRQYLTEHYPDWVVVREHSDRIIIRAPGMDEATLYLQKVYAAAATLKQTALSDRLEIYAQFARAVTDHLAGAVGPLTLAKHGSRIRPRLVLPAILRHLAEEQPIPHTALPDLGLEVVYVLDATHSVMYLTNQIMQELGLDRAGLHALALSNLAGTFPAEDLVRQVVERRELIVVKALDSYDAARLLLIPRYMRTGETLIAAVPDRDTLALLPEPANGNWEPIRDLARTPASEHLLLGVPLRVTAGGITRVRAAGPTGANHTEGKPVES
jgi:hypothetical protein